VSILIIPTAVSVVHRREKFDAAVIIAFVARGSEPSARQTERSGKRREKFGAVVIIAFVVRGSDPSARQAERSGKRRYAPPATQKS